MKKIMMTIGGNKVEAESMAVKPIEEPWSIYKLDDGSIIKLKLVVSDIFKLPNPDPVTGLPQFVVRSTNVVSVEPADVALSKREVH